MTTKTILMTGATGGIGRAAAFEFAKLGYALALVDLTQEVWTPLKKQPDSNKVASNKSEAV